MKKTFRVFYVDGNQKLFEADNMLALVTYLFYDCHETGDSIYAIEEAEEYE